MAGVLIIIYTLIISSVIYVIIEINNCRIDMFFSII